MRTAGSTALRALGRREEIAVSCGVSLATVSYWATGKKRPSMARRKILAERWGIPEGAWDTIVGAEPRRATTRAAKQARRAFRLVGEAAKALSEFIRLQSSEVDK